MAKKRLGELLLERGLIDVDQLNSALSYQRQWGHRLGTAMVAKGFISEGNLTRVLSESLQIPMVDLSKVHIDARATQHLKADTVERYEIFPIAVKEHKSRKTLLLAMADPLNVAAIDEVAFTTDMTVRPAIAQISSLRAAIRKFYFGDNVEIPPLDFSTKQRANVGEREVDADMTIIRAGGTKEEVVDTAGEVIDLTREVEAAEKLLEAQLQEQLLATPTAAHPQPPPQPPYAAPQGQYAVYQGQPTGAWMMAVPQQPPQPPPQQQAQQRTPPPPPAVELLGGAEPVEALEKKFWALMRILARRGLITKEEFLAELKND